jgi:hypothetical protein
MSINDKSTHSSQSDAKVALEEECASSAVDPNHPLVRRVMERKATPLL